MWKAARDLGRRASTAAGKLARRASTLLQSATKDDLSRADKLYTCLIEINKDTTNQDKLGEIDRLIAKFRAKQSSTGVVWHEGIIFRVAYIYFFHNAFKLLKAKILVTQNNYTDKLRAQNPADLEYLNKLLRIRKVVPRRFFEKLANAGHSRVVIAEICLNIDNFYKLYAVLRAIEPGRLDCPTLVHYSQRTQFTVRDAAHSLPVDINQLEPTIDRDPRDEIDLVDLFSLLLDPQFYITAVGNDPVALFLWSYLLSVITSLINYNHLAANPAFIGVTHTPSNFLNRINDLATQQGLSFETINRRNPSIGTALDIIFNTNLVFINAELSSLATKQLYLADLDAMAANLSISRADWLTGKVKQITSSGRAENWMLFAEALNIKATNFFATVMPPVQLYEPVVARIATADARVDPLANAQQKISSFLAEQLDLTVKIVSLNTGDQGRSGGEHPILILGLTQINPTILKDRTPLEQSLWQFYFAWNVALIQFANPDPSRILPIPPTVLELISEFKNLSSQFQFIIAKIFPTIQEARVYEALPASSEFIRSAPPPAAASAAIPSAVPSSAAAASAPLDPLYAELDDDETGMPSEPRNSPTHEYAAVLDRVPTRPLPRTESEYLAPVPLPLGATEPTTYGRAPMPLPRPSLTGLPQTSLPSSRNGTPPPTPPTVRTGATDEERWSDVEL